MNMQAVRAAVNTNNRLINMSVYKLPGIHETAGARVYIYYPDQGTNLSLPVLSHTLVPIY
jgi:hypothetical protein